MADEWVRIGTQLEAVVLWTSLLGVGAGMSVVALRLVREAVRAVRPSGASMLALAFALPVTALPSQASERRGTPPPLDASASPPPWSGSEGSSSPPPPPVRAGDHEGPRPALSDGHGSRVEVEEEAQSHPAIHGGRGPRVAPLFPRVSRRTLDPETRRAELAEAMRRHPAGKGLPSQGSQTSEPSAPATRYLVREGDTLWSIAARHLATDDLARIARYWPRIHKANRSVISDPNLIEPGWSLVLPKENER